MMEQRSEEWYQARLGIPTASGYSRITEARGKSAHEMDGIYFSDTSYTYLLELLTERLTGHHTELDTPAIRWGNDHEQMAKSRYETRTMTLIKEAPFVPHMLPNKTRTGASPDGYVGQGIIETKCPYNSINHVRTMVSGEVPKEYIPQVQGQLMCTGAEWVDFCSFDPRFSVDHNIVIIRVYPDIAYQEALSKRLQAFNKLLDRMYNKIMEPLKAA